METDDQAGPGRSGGLQEISAAQILLASSDPPFLDPANGLPDALVGSATTEVAGHVLVDLLIGGMGIFFRSAAAWSSCPGWQYPHWAVCSANQAL